MNSPSTYTSPSKLDIFAGYSYLAPKGTVNGVINPEAINYGAIGSVSRYFNNYLGMQVEGDVHNDGNENQPNDDFSGVAAGMVFRYPSEGITPFVHALVGAENAGSYYYPNVWGTLVTAGGGMDFDTPLFDHHLSIRLFQVDYQYTRDRLSLSTAGYATTNFNMARLSAGVVFKIGSLTPPPMATLACSASPEAVFPGDPIALTATAGNLLPKESVVYSWSGDGVTGNGSTGTVATAALAPGTYKVKCGVKEGKAGKEGLKPWQSAESTASFTVKAFEPPTLGCSASPNTVKPGETSAVTASGVSPQNRPLTYNYSAPSGSISGNTSTATFSSTGAPTGTVAVTCNVTDDKGQTATATTNVTVEAPPPPPAPPIEQTQLEAKLALHSIYFPTAKPTEKDPMGGLVDSQQAVLISLASDFQKYLAYKPDAHLILGGHADPRGTAEYNKALTERRVEKSKSFLVEHGVPAGDIDVQAYGSDDQLNSDQVKEQISQNTDLSEDDRKKILDNLAVIVLANNRRVDVTLSTTGQQSVRRYPFNMQDAMALIGTKEFGKKPVAKKKAKKQ
jgi:outer membrane protein OmpA-like peptidoglycan-associated protein